MYRTLQLNLLHEVWPHYAYFKTTPLASNQSTYYLKLLLITYKALNGLAPAYIKDLLKP